MLSFMSIFKKSFLYPRGNDIDIYQEMVLLPKTTFNIMTENEKPGCHTQKHRTWNKTNAKIQADQNACA